MVLLRLVVTASSVDPDPLHRHAGTDVTDQAVGLAAVALGQHGAQRLVLNLRDSVPERHVEHAASDGALAVAARLLAGHHDVPTLVWVEVCVAVVGHRGILRLKQARNEALFQDPARGVAAIAVEAKANDRESVALHICDDGHNCGRHNGVKVGNGSSSAAAKLDCSRRRGLLASQHKRWRAGARWANAGSHAAAAAAAAAAHWMRSFWRSR